MCSRKHRIITHDVRHGIQGTYRKKAAVKKTTKSRKIRPTRLHGFNAAKTRALYREGNIDWICVKTPRGWMKTDEYTYAAQNGRD